HSGSAIPTSNRIAGTANSTNYAVAIATPSGGGYSFQSQGGFNLNANTGTGSAQQQWVVIANKLGPLTAGSTFACQVQNTGSSNTDTKLEFTAGGNMYSSTAGGRCLITLTNVTFDVNGVASVEGTFVAELYTFKRDLAPLIINDGVFRWVK
ncbi:MAG: hypothetical protein ABIP46_08940, partial [Polaromonas sp.]